MCDGGGVWGGTVRMIRILFYHHRLLVGFGCHQLCGTGQRGAVLCRVLAIRGYQDTNTAARTRYVCVYMVHPLTHTTTQFPWEQFKGHTLGLGHSRVQGSSDEYSDSTSPMGYGVSVCYATPHLAKLTWLTFQFTLSLSNFPAGQAVERTLVPVTRGGANRVHSLRINAFDASGTDIVCGLCVDCLWIVYMD